MFSTPTTSRQASRKPRTASHQVATRTPPGSGSRRASQTQGSSPQYHGTPGPSSRLAQNVTTIEESVGDISMEQEEHAEARFSNEDEASSGTFSAGVFVRTPELKVSFFASLPLEVQQVLKTADFHQDAHCGTIDHATGFALLVTTTTCFVWNCAKRGIGSSTCYIFPAPAPSAANIHTAPVASLVPYGASREPGLLLSSATGEIRFWESIATGLSGAERFQVTHAVLQSNESITSLYRCEALVYIAATSSGRLFRLQLSTTGGKSRVVATPFSRTQSVFSRVKSSLFSGGGVSASAGGGIVSVALGVGNSREGRNIWALTDKTVQKWRVSSESWEQLLAEQDIYELVGLAIIEKLGLSDTITDNQLEVELHDLSIEGDNDPVVLISYAGYMESQPETSSELSRSYAVVKLGSMAGSFQVQQLYLLSYRQDRDARPASEPMMMMLDEGAIVFIQFVDAVSVMSIAPGTTFRETLPLKDSWDRTLGFGRIPQDESKTKAQGRARDVDEVSIVTAGCGLLTFQMNLTKIRGSNPETPTNHLVGTMEQAIFFGSSAENPFLFRFGPHFDGDLGVAAEKLSQEILSSRGDYMQSQQDLRHQLSDRQTRLRSLIRFVHENGALARLPQASRQRLSHDAERLTTAGNLWIYHNRPADDTSSPQSRGLLIQAIELYMQESGESMGQDFVRAFFKSKISDFGAIFERLHKILESANGSASFNNDHRIQDVLPEINRITLNCYESALRFRLEYSELYGIDKTVVYVERWSSKPAQLDILQVFYEATVRLLDESRQAADASRGAGSGTSPALQALLREQLREMASVVLASHQEYLDLLSTPQQTDGNERDFNAAVERFKELRPRVLRPLVRYGSSDVAFRLGEEYHDYRFLTELCQEPGVGTPGRIRHYIDSYREAFAFELYQWYIENGQLRLLLDQDEHYPQLLDQFLKAHSNPRIEWIHDLATRKFEGATRSLVVEANTEARLGTKHIMLSIAKLCAVAQIGDGSTSIDEQPEESAHAIEVCNEQLDLVSVHEMLLKQFQTVINSSSISARHPTVETQAKTVAAAIASELSDKPAFSPLFRRLAKQLLQGQSLSSEELIDLLTLQNTNVAQFGEALDVLPRTRDLPDERYRSALRAIWRRVFIGDDWSELQNTSQLNDEQINAHLRQTLLYVTLSHALQKDMPDHFILSPTAALPIPTATEIAIRFPELTENGVHDVAQDYDTENVWLAGLVGSNNLEGWFQRTLELVREEIEE